MAQRIDDFMRDLFQARIAEEKAILANRTQYRKRFSAPECTWDNRQFNLEMIQSERILQTENSGSHLLVTTEYTASVSPPGARTTRRRYHLRAHGDSFLVFSVERQCPYCHGEGDETCTGCKGKH